MPNSSIEKVRAEAIRYWERRRVVYNVALIPPSLISYLLCATITSVGEWHRLQSGLVVGLFVMAAVGANICYTFAYVLEFFFGTEAPDSHRVQHGRTAAFAGGVLLGMVLALLGGRQIALVEFYFR